MRRNLLIAVFDQGFVSGTTFISGIIVARLLGSEAFGAYILANGLFLFLASLQQAFLLAPMSVYGASDSPDTAQYLGATGYIQVILALFISFVFYIISHLGIIQSQSLLLKQAFTWMAPVAFFQLIYEFWRQLLITRQLLPTLLTTDLIAKFILLLPLVSISLLNPDAASLPVVYILMLLSAFFGIITAVVTARGHVQKPDKIRVYLEKNYQYGKWASANQLVLMGNGQLPIYVTAFILGTSMAGVLGAAIQLLGVFQIFLNGLVNYWLPISVRAFKSGGYLALKKSVSKAMLLMLSIITIITVPAVFYAEALVSAIFGAEFLVEGVLPYQIFLTVAIALGFSRALDVMMRVLEKMKLRTRISIIELLFIGVAIYPAAYYFGLVGVASVGVLGRFISTGLLFMAVWSSKAATTVIIQSEKIG